MTYPNNLIIDRLNQVSTNRIPVWLMRQAGRHLPGYQKLRKAEPDFIKFIENKDLTTQAALEPIQRYDLDAAIIFSDILSIPHWMGWPVAFNPGYGIEIPKITSHRLDQLSLSRLADNLELLDASMRDLKKHVTDRPIIGFTGAPWTLACYLLDRSKNQFIHARQMLYSQPQFLKDLMTQLTAGIIMSIDTQIQAGADIIMLFDSWAGLLPTEIYKKHCTEHMLAIQKHIRSKNIPFILFAKGQSYSVQSTFNPDCVTLDWHQTWPEQTSHTIQGGFDPAILLTSPEIIYKTVKNKLSIQSNAHYIANMGHGIPPEATPENVQAFVDAIRSIQP